MRKLLALALLLPVLASAQTTNWCSATNGANLIAASSWNDPSLSLTNPASTNVVFAIDPALGTTGTNFTSSAANVYFAQFYSSVNWTGTWLLTGYFIQQNNTPGGTMLTWNGGTLNLNAKQIYVKLRQNEPWPITVGTGTTILGPQESGYFQIGVSPTNQTPTWATNTWDLSASLNRLGTAYLYLTCLSGSQISRFTIDSVTNTTAGIYCYEANTTQPILLVVSNSVLGHLGLYYSGDASRYTGWRIYNSVITNTTALGEWYTSSSARPSMTLSNSLIVFRYRVSAGFSNAIIQASTIFVRTAAGNANYSCQGSQDWTTATLNFGASSGSYTPPSSKVGTITYNAGASAPSPLAALTCGAFIQTNTTAAHQPFTLTADSMQIQSASTFYPSNSTIVVNGNLTLTGTGAWSNQVGNTLVLRGNSTVRGLTACDVLSLDTGGSVVDLGTNNLAVRRTFVSAGTPSSRIVASVTGTLNIQSNAQSYVAFTDFSGSVSNKPVTGYSVWSSNSATGIRDMRRSAMGGL